MAGKQALCHDCPAERDMSVGNCDIKSEENFGSIYLLTTPWERNGLQKEVI